MLCPRFRQGCEWWKLLPAGRSGHLPVAGGIGYAIQHSASALCGRDQPPGTSRLVPGEPSSISRITARSDPDRASSSAILGSRCVRAPLEGSEGSVSSISRLVAALPGSMYGALLPVNFQPGAASSGIIQRSPLPGRAQSERKSVSLLELPAFNHFLLSCCAMRPMLGPRTTGPKGAFAYCYRVARARRT
jgi:hypothetical protein